MEKRSPIVTILGHIDHGKTTLLDFIRRDNVVKTEAGGITQGLGAYEIEHKGNKITFIDTPGHEAFSAMRAHGARIADIAVLVVAADDGVMPQTENAISYIKEAGIPFIVAINKIDVEGANIEKVKSGLTRSEVYLEGMGGDVSFQTISALKGDGVDELLDLINLTAEVEGLEYDPDKPGEGVIIKSNRSSKRGIMVGVIIKNGVVKKGDKIFSEKSSQGKIKIIENFLGEQVNELRPSSPALILGFDNLPEVGEKFKIGAKPELNKATEENKNKEPKSTESEENSIKVIIKADESGSLEALHGLINRISKESPMEIIDEGVGDISETDIKNALSFKAVIVGFNTGVYKSAGNISKTEKINIITSNIIYELEDKLREYIKSEAVKEERIIEVLATFGKQEGNRQIIGGKVIKGYVENNEKFEVFRGDKKVGEGRIINLQSQKEDIPKAEEEQEVGLLVESEVDILEGHHLVFNL